MRPLTRLLLTNTLLACGLLIANSAVVCAQTVMNPVSNQVVRYVQVQFQHADVPPDELVKAEQNSASPPATVADIVARLQTALVGPSAVRLRDELARNRWGFLLRHPLPQIIQDSDSTEFSTQYTPIVPHGETVTPVMSTSIKTRIQPDGTVGVKLVWETWPSTTDSRSMTNSQTVVVAFTIPSGQLAVVALPSPPGKPEHLVFLTVTVQPDTFQFKPEPKTPDIENPGDMNVYPRTGTDPNSMDQMQIHPPDVRDPMSVLPPPSIKPTVSPGGK